MYTVVLFTKVLPQHVDDYIQNMRVCAEKTNQEPGCIRYEVMQDTSDPTLMLLFQIFRDEEAYQAHQDAEHHRVWIEMSRDWRDPSVRTRHEMRYVTPAPSRAAALRVGRPASSAARPLRVADAAETICGPPLRVRPAPW